MRVTTAAVVLALAGPAPAGAATVSQSATGALRTVAITGDTAWDTIDVELEDPRDPRSDVIVYGPDALEVGMASTGCAVGLPGEVRCSAPAVWHGEVRVAFRGYEGHDTLRIAPGMSVRFAGGPGDDRLETEPAQALSVVATGDDGDDTFLGGRAADVLDGGAGADRLEGFASSDRLLGGAGEDVLIGGPGRDRMDCGAGRDTARADAADGRKGVRRCEKVARPKQREHHA
jgi:Ca2+-binding RTX toxin-like protein